MTRASLPPLLTMRQAAQLLGIQSPNPTRRLRRLLQALSLKLDEPLLTRVGYRTYLTTEQDLRRALPSLFRPIPPDPSVLDAIDHQQEQIQRLHESLKQLRQQHNARAAELRALKQSLKEAGQ
jgi:hypothetical protein